MSAARELATVVKINKTPEKSAKTLEDLNKTSEDLTKTPEELIKTPEAPARGVGVNKEARHDL